MITLKPTEIVNKELQVERDDGNVLLGIGRALSSAIVSRKKEQFDYQNRVGDIDVVLSFSFSLAASNIIQACGTAVKDSTTGLILFVILGRK